MAVRHTMNRLTHGAMLALMALMALASGRAIADGNNGWRIDTTNEWQAAASQIEGLTVSDGLLALTGKQGLYRSRLQCFKEKRAAHTLTLTASTAWENWEPTQRKVVPPTLADAPIFLAKGPKDYWLFGRYQIPKGSEAKNFAPAPATLEGFSERLQTTPFPHLFEASGGLQKSLGGYHAWQSRDMLNWVHHGPVTTGKAKWATTAEFVDGKIYLYYDFPNDQDPHLVIDDDLFDGKPGQDMGRVFNGLTDGSDCAVIRDLDGRFHLIYEDWSPIDASKHSWDSPLAGHAVSDDGKGNFEILAAAVDERTQPTGTFAEYAHDDRIADAWSDWQDVKEQYESIAGFAKQVKRIPATMDLSRLPEGYGFCFELCLEDTTANMSAPTLDRVEIRFRD